VSLSLKPITTTASIEQPSIFDAPPPAAGPQSEAKHTVASLTKAIKNVLETAFTDVVVEGEISNFTDHRSGHRYWTLKDSGAAISSVLWKTRVLNFQLKEGMKVICRGRLSLYAPRGSYQLDVYQVRPVGVGDLQQAFEALRAKLEKEGLFHPGRKRELPRFPRTIGIVTSETGAALQDILTVLRRRYPLVSVLLRPAAVQGVGSELDVARAIQEFNLLAEERRPDLLIVGRGGGSLEDLWCFNEEAVARAIYASEIPIVSAVGHEVDVTIADMVADLRAPTPTAAAELVTPDMEDLTSYLEGTKLQIKQTMQHTLRLMKRNVEGLASGYALRSRVQEQLRHRRQDASRLDQSMQRSVAHRIERLKLQLERDGARLKSMSPLAVLERGYVILERPDGGVIARGSEIEQEGLTEGSITFADGKQKVYFF
jgi:exodeoxyribonuclease VII large subunit